MIKNQDLIKNQRKLSIYREFYILFKRNMLIWTRNKFSLMIRCVVLFVFALIYSAIYYVRSDGDKFVQDTSGLLFFVCLN